MSFKTHRSNRDANHKAICNALRRAGYSVYESEKVDAIVSSKLRTVFAEIKTEKGVYALSQLETLALHPGYSATFKNEDEALQIMKSPHAFCYTETEKARILQIVHRYRDKTKAKYPQISCDVFEREMKAFD